MTKAISQQTMQLKQDKEIQLLGLKNKQPVIITDRCYELIRAFSMHIT